MRSCINFTASALRLSAVDTPQYFAHSLNQLLLDAFPSCPPAGVTYKRRELCIEFDTAENPSSIADANATHCAEMLNLVLGVTHLVEKDSDVTCIRVSYEAAVESDLLARLAMVLHPPA